MHLISISRVASLPVDSHHRARAQRRLTAMFVAAAAVLLTPPRFVERGPRLCLSRLILSRECPGCGMTRAMSCALHGRMSDAVAFNPRVVVVLPLVTGLWLREVRRLWRVVHAR